MNGKGDKRRPMQISQQEWENNWIAIFGDKNGRMKFTMHLRIKDCNEQFHPDFAPGVIASQEVEFKNTKGATDTQLAMALMEHKRRFIEENVTVDVEQ